jgi:hypothetical protein
MKNPIKRSQLNLAVVPLFTALLASCGAAEGDVGQLEEELTPTLATPSIVTCSYRDPDGVITQRGDTGPEEESRSPTKYGVSGCPKAWVVDALPPAVVGSSAIRVEWSDMWERNQAQCEGATLKVSVYSSGLGGLPQSEGSMEAPLLWGAGHCYYDDITVWFLRPDIFSVGTWSLRRGPVDGATRRLRSLTGKTVRVVASALAPGGYSTQPLTVVAAYE